MWQITCNPKSISRLLVKLLWTDPDKAQDSYRHERLSDEYNHMNLAIPKHAVQSHHTLLHGKSASDGLFDIVCNCML